MATRWENVQFCFLLLWLFGMGKGNSRSVRERLLEVSCNRGLIYVAVASLEMVSVASGGDGASDKGYPEVDSCRGIVPDRLGNVGKKQ